jgi:hypothetical protein
MRQRAVERRAVLNADECRLVQSSAPGTRHQDHAIECRRQSLFMRKDLQEIELLDFIEATMDTSGWV